MDQFTAHDITLANGEKTRYYEGGSPTGTPLIFIHGWPDLAEAWKHQLSHFSSGAHNYRVIAPDMRGYGASSAPSNREAYALSVLVPELVDLAAQLNISKAVWIGHDWGCGVLNALAAHHPELCLGLALLSVPYRTAELGLDNNQPRNLPRRRVRVGPVGLPALLRAAHGEEPPELCRRAHRAHDKDHVCAPRPAQVGAAGADESDYQGRGLVRREA
jgi:pimeloyl-ACP methyl ester carboxylesterase